MKTSIEHAWDAARERVTGSQISEGGLILFRIDELSEQGSYGGVDEFAHALFAIEVGAVPPLIPLESRALDYFRYERKATKTWLMVIRLRKKELEPVFAKLCQDLIDRIEAANQVEDVLCLARTRIDLWKKLFDSTESGLLQDFQIKGLIAELLFLDSQLLEGAPAKQWLAVVCAWVGPSGADQDFLFSDRAIEVKAIGPSSEGVGISSLDQLCSPLPLILHVQTVRRASPDETRAVTLNKIVTRIEARIRREPAALQVFRDALISAGYVTHPHYDEVAFEPMLTEEFQVDSAFPRLIPREIPIGISSASYVLSLRSIRNRH
ncbi:MAG: hypothetical protein DDT34_01166 [Firmicutes bacterium]|nr:hypothetical protein [Bacillota bacterium]